MGTGGADSRQETEPASVSPVELRLSPQPCRGPGHAVPGLLARRNCEIIHVSQSHTGLWEGWGQLSEELQASGARVLVQGPPVQSPVLGAGWPGRGGFQAIIASHFQARRRHRSLLYMLDHVLAQMFLPWKPVQFRSPSFVKEGPHAAG